MAETFIKYATDAAITITLNSLGSGSARESTAVVNTTNEYVDAIVELAIVAGASGMAAGDYVAVYAYCSVDETNYSGGATGSDAAITLGNEEKGTLRLLGAFPLETNSDTIKPSGISIAGAFGGRLPPKWGIVVDNQTSAAFASSGCSASYRGITYTDA